ncbi:MAG: hypothetical protein WCP20_23840 [Desulfuromonadales bacterium]
MTNFRKIDATLTVNGKSMQLGNESLCNMLMSFLDELASSDILAELSFAEDSELRRCVARSKNLNAETVARLVKDPSERVVAYLLDSKSAIKYLTQEEIIEAINRSAEIAGNVAENLGRLSKINPNVDIAELYRILASHHDSRVRGTIAKSAEAPLAVIQSLVLDSDADVAYQAKDTEWAIKKISVKS